MAGSRLVVYRDGRETGRNGGVGFGVRKDGCVHYLERGERYAFVQTDAIVYFKYVQFVIFNYT